MENEEKRLKVITPEIAFAKFSIWFDDKKKLAFLVALLAGIITHITMITETILSQDGLWNSIEYFRPGLWEATLGRWGIAIIERLNNFIAIPTVATISCILSISIAAVLLVDLFDFKNKIYIVLTSLMLVVTPTLTVTLLYVYTSFAYCFNFLLSTLVIWFLYKFKYKKIGFFLSILCFMFSLSIYQSYIGVSIGLCAMLAMIDLLKGKKEVKSILFDVGKTVIVVIIGAILYYITTMIVLKVLKLEIATYKGAQNISLTRMIFGLKDTIVQAYKDFIIFFFGDTIVYNSNYRRELIYGLFFAMFGIASIIAIIKIKEEQKKIKSIKALLAIGIILVLPICLNIIDILVVGTEAYALTAPQMILMIPLTFAIFEIISDLSTIKWLAIIACLGVILTYYIADNTSYAALKLTYNQAYSTTMRIMDRIETTEGYNESYPILFGGIIGNYNYERTSSLYTYTVGSIVNNPTFHGSYHGSIGTWVKFIKIFYGLDVVPCADDVYYKIVTSEQFKQMSEFPGKDSVKVIDGIIVLKMTESPELPF